MLSVIVPVYNSEATLLRCLDSILNQSYEDFELILVDDGSTDGSPALCDAYAQRDSRITVLHIENSGPFQARKLGAEKAAGGVLTFSDADDWLERDAFETAMGIFCKSEPDILAYTYDCGEGRIEKQLYEERLYCESEIKDRVIPGIIYDTASGRPRLNPSLCCKVIKKELFTKVTESVNDRITLGDDALVSYPAVCMAESIYICNRVLYHYTSRDSSCTHRYPLERINEVRAFQDNLMRLFEEMGMLDLMRYQIENYVRMFLNMMIKNWYGMSISPVMYAFPYRSVPKGARIFIYGAGCVGKSYISQLKVTGYAGIAGWADRNYEELKEYNDVEIIAPKQIRGKKFDLLLIAVEDEKAAYGIRQELAGKGIPSEKIIWEKPVAFV